MSGESSKWREMANSVIQIFGNDGTIDMKELNYLMGLALEDGHIDEKEKNVLKGILGQVTEELVTPEVWTKITEIKEKYSL